MLIYVIKTALTITTASYRQHSRRTWGRYVGRLLITYRLPSLPHHVNFTLAARHALRRPVAGCRHFESHATSSRVATLVVATLLHVAIVVVAAHTPPRHAATSFHYCHHINNCCRQVYHYCLLPSLVYDTLSPLYRHTGCCRLATYEDITGYGGATAAGIPHISITIMVLWQCLLHAFRAMSLL